MKIGICRLCHREAQLSRSHIVPKAVVNPLKAEKGFLLQVNGRGPYGLKKHQDGFVDFLLCRQCEGFCSKEYEEPFVESWRTRAASSPWPRNHVVSLQVDYRQFKLFHLLNLFRASVCTLPYFRHVDLKSNEEIIRKMLLNGDPGGIGEYCVAARVIYSKTNGMISEAISTPEPRSDGGKGVFYSTLYYGIEWTVFMTPRGSKNLRKNALQPDGSITISGSPWGKHWFLRQAAMNLAGKQDWVSS